MPGKLDGCGNVLEMITREIGIENVLGKDAESVVGKEL